MVAPLAQVGVFASHDDAHGHVRRCYLGIIGLLVDAVVLVGGPILAVLVYPLQLLLQVVDFPRSSVVVVHQWSDVYAQSVDAVLVALDVLQERCAGVVPVSACLLSLLQCPAAHGVEVVNAALAAHGYVDKTKEWHQAVDVVRVVRDGSRLHMSHRAVGVVEHVVDRLFDDDVALHQQESVGQ